MLLKNTSGVHLIVKLPAISLQDIIKTKPNKGNGVVILDRKLYDNPIQKIISDTSKSEMLNEDPTLKR